MQFFIEARQFEHEFGLVWRGRAVAGDGKKELDFFLPLPKNAELSRAEVATVYELVKIIPSLTGPGDTITVLVSSEATRLEVLDTPEIMCLLGDITVKLEVYEKDEDTTT